MADGAALELAGVGKSYGLLHKKPALRCVDLRVARGDCFGLAGANGAGKTTLIRILLGLIEPDEGEARLLGEPPTDAEVRRRVGFVPEAAMLPESASPRALVRRWARLRGLPAQAAMDEGLDALGQLGMGGLLDRASGKLSKGERQRTLLALALLGRPELLVLDEPTDGLDPLGRARMREVIRARCAEGTTVFLNSHLLAETERMCSRVGILHQGQLVRVEHLARARGFSGPAVSAIRLAAPLDAAQLARAQVQPLPDPPGRGREPGAEGVVVRIAHETAEQLNAAIDRLRAEGALLTELRREQADLEDALAEVAAGAPLTAEQTAAMAAGGGAHLAPDREASLASTHPGSSASPARAHPLRAPTAVLRVSLEIAADLASRRIGWLALGAGLLAGIAFFLGIRSDVMQGAASAAHQFGGHFTDAAGLGRTTGKLVAQVFFWASLCGGVLLAAVFTPSLLEPRRTVLLYSQPITRADYAIGIWAATSVLALVTAAFFHGLAFLGLRALGIAAPWTLLLAPLTWALAFASVLALQLLVALPARNGLVTGGLGFALLLSTSVLGEGHGLASIAARHDAWGFLYALLPRTMDLMSESGRLGEGLRPLARGLLPTAGLTAAYLFLLRALALRSES